MKKYSKNPENIVSIGAKKEILSLNENSFMYLLANIVLVIM